MKYVDEYRDGGVARSFAARIADAALLETSYRFMEFCGGHTHAISRYGIADLLPPNIRMIHGPGCPVCVLPIGRVDAAITLSHRPKVTLCVYGDLMRVPGSRGMSLLKAKAAGADVRMVYSALDAIRIARAEPEREVVFFAIGFETTTPPTALVIQMVAQEALANFSVFCNHVLTPPAIHAILDSPAMRVEAIGGIIGPSHVSTIIGMLPYEPLARQFRTPIVITGFEPLDVMQSILMLVHQVNGQRCNVENQYTRVVTLGGNARAQAAMADVFGLRESFDWRGLGALPWSALRIREAYGKFDAEKRFDIEEIAAEDNPACECGAILCGVKTPSECKLFGTVCTPDTPMGSCMVSSEGACAAHWAYGRFRDHARRAP